MSDKELGIKFENCDVKIDKMFDIHDNSKVIITTSNSNTDKCDAETKTSKKCRTDCCFFFDNEEYFAIAIQEFTNKLKSHKLIESTLEVKSMMSLFRGRSCRTTYKWLGDNHILTWIIKGLCNENNPIVTTWPDGTSKWDVVSNRFLDKNGNPMSNIRQETKRIKQESVINDIVQALASYM